MKITTIANTWFVASLGRRVCRWSGKKPRRIHSHAPAAAENEITMPSSQRCQLCAVLEWRAAVNPRCHLCAVLEWRDAATPGCHLCAVLEFQGCCHSEVPAVCSVLVARILQLRGATCVQCWSGKAAATPRSQLCAGVAGCCHSDVPPVCSAGMARLLPLRGATCVQCWSDKAAALRGASCVLECSLLPIWSHCTGLRACGADLKVPNFRGWAI